MTDPQQTLAHLDTIWAAIDDFFQPFSEEDWSRQHGKEWTYADMPYHLAYFNQTAVEGIGNDHE